MRGKSATFLLIVILLITAVSYLDLKGITIGSASLPSVDKGIRKGFDISGGSIITYEAQVGPNGTVTTADGDTVVQILRTRATYAGYTEANVTKAGEKRFIVEIPAVSDPEMAVKTLGATAKLSFVDPDKNEVISGKDVDSAQVKYEQLSQNAPAENVVALTLKDEGVQKFDQATKRLASQPSGKNYIAIMLDDKVVSQPTVKEEINSKDCYIEGSFTAETAKNLADTIRAGQLPFGLQEVALSSEGATLGESAFNVSVKAGAIALLLVILFIMLFYRLPGIVAAIALIGYTAILAFILGAVKINLTLPGIAGMILSIGMAVDANVITFERIIDELKSGKTLMAAIDAGFHRALTAIIDSNVTTVIAAVVLMWLGTGTVVGFALTLFIGVILSLLTAVIITRLLLVNIVGLNVKTRWLYGIGLR